MPSQTINKRGMSRTIHDSPWLDHDQANSLASIRLFCFPYVGGGSWIYRGWSDYAGKEIEIIPLALPGRDKRLWEQPHSSLSPLIGALAEVLPQDKPFAFFGHSMGALIAFELARELYQRDSELPLCLFASGASAPQTPRRSVSRHLLSDADLGVELRVLGGTPEDVLQDSGMMELFLPAIRADFAIGETYEYAQSNLLDCPIFVLHGDEDPETSRDEALAWRACTSSAFRIDTFHGGHFFLHAAKKSIVTLIKRELSALTQAGAQSETSPL
ncbi:MAG: alpha/beta fold hydrolase [Candidatus Sulfotelmatobacter sp.]